VIGSNRELPGDEATIGETCAIRPGDLIRAASTISFARGVLGKGLKGVTATNTFEGTFAATVFAWVSPALVVASTSICTV
jgi:hypothetical protein